jgi:hypothetical protein
MATPNKSLREWLEAANPVERKRLAIDAGTSVKQLEHIASGRRNASAALAQRLAHSSRQFNPALRLDQRELCTACGQCPYAGMVSK